MSVSIRIAGVATAAAVALGGGFTVSAAHADDAATTAPCDQQQTARQQARVTKAKKVAARAEAGALADAKHDRAETKVTKRAQQQRLAKAQERLTTCEATQETTEAPVPA